MDNLIDRLKWLISEHSGGKYTVFAKKAGIPHSTLQNYMNGRTPHVDHLLRIHDIYGVNINWLLTGEGVASLKEGEGAAVDMSLLGDTIRIVEEWLEQNKRRLTPEKKAEVVLYLYEEYLEKEEKPETATVERLLKLVA